MPKPNNLRYHHKPAEPIETEVPKTTVPELDPNKTNTEEEILFTSLRAKNWRDFAGQETVKKSLQIAIKAAQQRHESLDHTLFNGPPGSGKTTLSHLIAG